MTGSEQLATVLVTSAVPTVAVLVGVLVNDFRLSALIRAFEAGTATANRHFANLKNVRRACLLRTQR